MITEETTTVFDTLSTRFMMPMLVYIVKERLQFSKTWTAVDITENPSSISIKWNTPKDPEGSPFHTVVLPNSFKALSTEIQNQYSKLCRKQ